MQTARYIVRAASGDGGVVTRRFGAETLLVPVCAGVGDLDSVYTLNEVGTTIWDALAQPTVVTELVALIATDYDVGLDQASIDVDAFLADLAQLGLVRTFDQGAAVAAGEPSHAGSPGGARR